MTWEEITNRPMTREEAIKQLREFIILHQEQHGWDVSTIKALEKAIKALEQEPCEDKEYEKDLNKLKEQILKEGNTLVSKQDLLDRFVEIDNEYKKSHWNLLQILTNIDILIGQEPCDDCISRRSAIEAARDLCEHYTPTKSVNHPHMDFVIEALLDLPSVTPQNAKYRKEARRWKNKALGQKQVLDKIRAEIERQEKWLMDAGYTTYNVDIAFDAIKSVVAESEIEK